MDEQSIKSALKAVGISSAIITVVVVGGVAVMAYRNYFEIKLTKLQIAELEKALK